MICTAQYSIVLTVSANSATSLGSIPASFDTVKFEGYVPVSDEAKYANVGKTRGCKLRKFAVISGFGIRYGFGTTVCLIWIKFFIYPFSHIFFIRRIKKCNTFSILK
jgi:hypothetical protein